MKVKLEQGQISIAIHPARRAMVARGPLAMCSHKLKILTGEPAGPEGPRGPIGP